MLALAIALLLLFPVISADDDLFQLYIANSDQSVWSAGEKAGTHHAWLVAAVTFNPPLSSACLAEAATNADQAPLEGCTGSTGDRSPPRRA